MNLRVGITWLVLVWSIWMAGSVESAQPIRISEYSPYVMLHELGIFVKPTGGGTAPDGFPRSEFSTTRAGIFTMRPKPVDYTAFSPEVRGGMCCAVTGILCGRRTSACGLELSDIVMNLEDIDSKQLQSYSYMEFLSELRKAAQNSETIKVQRAVWNANREIAFKMLELNIGEETTRSVPLPETDRNYVLNELIKARHSILLGDWQNAESTLQEALSHMEEKEVEGEGSKRTEAMVAAEGLKYFKGDVYEVAMANCYAGLLNLAQGETEDALVGVKRSLLNDMESKKQEHQDDFGASHLLAACIYKCLNELDNSKLAFDKVANLNSRFSAPDDFNTVLVVELGKAPVKAFTGIEGEMDKVIRASYPESSVEISIDGESKGRAEKVLDLYEQATTVGRTMKDGAQVGKAILKFGLRLAAACVSSDLSDVVGRVWDVRADTRTWDNIPGEVHVLLCALPEGMHTTTLKFFNSNDQQLKRFEQTWYCLPVENEKMNVFLFQSGYDRCNIAEPQELAKIWKVSGKKQEVVFFSRDVADLQIGELLDIVSLGKPITDEAGEILKVEMTPVGHLKVMEIKGKKAYGTVEDVEGKVTKEMYLARF